MCKFSDNTPCIYEQQFLAWEKAEYSIELSSKEIPLDSDCFCIFHSKDLQWKREKEFSDYLLIYLNLCQKANNNNPITLSNSIIIGGIDQKINLSKYIFNKTLKITNCIFEDYLTFENSTFEKEVDFYKCTFNDNVHFNFSKFLGKTLICNCVFNKPAYFNDSVFIACDKFSHSSFTGSIFNEQANFTNTQYLSKDPQADADATFQLVQFKQNVYFKAALFERQVIFNGSTFEGLIDFRSTTFNKKALFNKRKENDKINIVRFNNVDFTDVKFNEAAEFEEADLRKSIFNSTYINTEMLFRDSVFGICDFINIELNNESRLSFLGTKDNKVFNNHVNLNISKQKINGYIYFDNIKVSWISKTQIELLRSLEKNGKVFFRDCEFEANVIFISYSIEGTSGNLILLQTIFQNLSKWINFFTNGIQTCLHVDPTYSETSEIKIKVIYLRTEDLELFKKLTKYFFDCLNEEEDENLAEILKTITDDRFFAFYSISDNKRYPNLTFFLKMILNETISWVKGYTTTSRTELSINSKFLTEYNFTNIENIILFQIKKILEDFLETLKIEPIKTIQFIINMGDSFSNISGTVINRSLITSSFNKIKEHIGEESAKLLEYVTLEINKSGNKDACELMESFHEELQKPEPKKSLLKSLWNGLVTAMPSLISNADKVMDIIEKVGKTI